MRNRLIALLLGVAACGLLAAAPAGAAAPAKDTFTIHITDTITDICPFPIHLQGRADVMESVFTNRNGDLIRIVDHVAERDVFSAHGTSIRTDTYHYTVHVLFDEQGNLLHAYSTGQVVRMRLSDGSQFSSAGRVDVLNSPGPFTIVPDVGHSGNVDAFCAALS
jgi:hypothetical protein